MNETTANSAGPPLAWTPPVAPVPATESNPEEILSPVAGSIGLVPAIDVVPGVTASVASIAESDPVVAPVPSPDVGMGARTLDETGHRLPLAGREVTYIAGTGDPVAPGTICCAFVRHAHNWQAVDLWAVAPKGSQVSEWFVPSVVLGGSRVPLGTPRSWHW